MSERFDNYSNLSQPVALPCFVGNDRAAFDVWCNGYAVEEMIYDGFTNKLRITPLVRNPATLGMVAVGEDYTIGVGHLTRLILAENARGAR